MDHSRDITGELSKQGYRMTPQRMMILATIEKSDDHISAGESYSQAVATYPNVNISTVYRTLELLERLGLVTCTDLGEGRVRYHPVEKGHHHHPVCRECGATLDLKESLLTPRKDALLPGHGFIADLKHLAILGRCVNFIKYIYIA